MHVETVDQYLARGGQITVCEPAYCAPTLHATKRYSHDRQIKHLSWRETNNNLLDALKRGNARRQQKAEQRLRRIWDAMQAGATTADIREMLGIKSDNHARDLMRRARKLMEAA